MGATRRTGALRGHHFSEIVLPAGPMSLPINKREFDFFLSHAHSDRPLASALHGWLSEKAGLSVWYDAREMAAGAFLATDLQAAIGRCRGVLLLASDESLKRGWVVAEYNAAMDERANHDGFRVVAFRVRGADVTPLMRGISWIDLPDGALTADAALALIRALYPGDKRPIPRHARDVFVSCSWHPDDRASARGVCQALMAQGFRLIGDAQDQRGFGTGDRVERIMSSCGAFVGVIPFRGVERARREEAPYKYFLREADAAARLGLPSLVVADPRVRREDGPDEHWLSMETAATRCPEAVASALAGLWDDWSPPRSPHYVFLAIDLESEAARPASAVRDLIERITGMPTVVGHEIHDHPLQSGIMRKISEAFLVLADITDDNLNTCIEAGMALAVGANLEIFARGEPRRPPFMLRALQMPVYADHVEHVAVLHRIVRPYRRRVINGDL